MAMPHVNSRMGVRPRLIAATTFLICLMPSLVSLGWGFARPTEHTRLPQAEMRPLAMHIHMIHLREFDLREGKAIGRFEFHNAAEAPLKIDRIKPSCGCVTTRLLQPRKDTLREKRESFTWRSIPPRSRLALMNTKS